MTKLHKTILLLAVIIFVYPKIYARAAEPVVLTVESQDTINGIAGDYVTVQGNIFNTTSQPIQSITTYLSLVDNNTKMPVDLEDWSAEKGLFIGSIETNQNLPLNWKIHFVKAGDYSLIIVAEIMGRNVPTVSTVTQFHVQSKRNLNPGQVLPVALGMPILVLILISFLYYYRQRQLQNY